MWDRHTSFPIVREESLTHNAERHNAITVIADRDLDGVRKCVLDAVYRAQGRGCSPYTIGVGIGAAARIRLLVLQRNSL